MNCVTLIRPSSAMLSSVIVERRCQVFAPGHAAVAWRTRREGSGWAGDGRTGRWLPAGRIDCIGSEPSLGLAGGREFFAEG